MEKRKNFLKILFLLCLIIFVCYNLSEEATLKRRGKRNAIKYIVEKYDFRPKVKEVRCESIVTDLIPYNCYNTGNVWVYMTYKKQDFKVFISGEERTTEGCDNYQEEIIKQAITDKIHEYVTNVNEIDICFSRHGYGYVSEYYDGTNLDEVLNSCDVNQFKVITTESGLERVTENSIKNTFGDNANFLFLDFKEKPIDLSKYNDMNLFSKRVFYDFLSDNEVYLNEVKAKPIDDYNKQTEMISLHYTDQQNAAFKYRYENGTYCTFNKIEPEYFNEWMEDFEYSQDAQKVIYDIYSVDTDASKVIIMLPYDGFNVDRVISLKPRFYYETISDGNKNRRGNSNVLEEEGYIVTSLTIEDTKNIMFTVVKVDNKQIVN